MHELHCIVYSILELIKNQLYYVFCCCFSFYLFCGSSTNRSLFSRFWQRYRSETANNSVSGELHEKRTKFASKNACARAFCSIYCSNTKGSIRHTHSHTNRHTMKDTPWGKTTARTPNRFEWYRMLNTCTLCGVYNIRCRYAKWVWKHHAKNKKSQKIETCLFS